MAFMVLNTGRVASQYFYINLKLQKSIMMPSRYEFDHIVKSYIKRHYKRPLKRFKVWQEKNLQKNNDLATGIVFHSVRRNLIYPLNSQRNISFLKDLRDEIGLDTIFFPVRKPDAVFISELNRQLARCVGDWAFPNGLNNWRKKWNINEIDSLSNHELTDDLTKYLPASIDESDLKEASKNFIVETGKILPLFDLFSSVFDKVKIFDYKDLSNDSESVFEKMGQIAGFELTDRSLIQTRLNGLSNRFMIYNTFSITVDRRAQLKWKETGIIPGDGSNYKVRLKSIHRVLTERQNPMNRVCRFKFEISSVLPVCEDWGKFQQVSILPEPLFKTLIKTLGCKIAIGVHVDDFGNFSREEMKEMIKFIHSIVAPRFEVNFQIMSNYYRDSVYYKELPSTGLYAKFWNECGNEYDKMEKIMTSSKNVL